MAAAADASTEPMRPLLVQLCFLGAHAFVAPARRVPVLSRRRSDAGRAEFLAEPEFDVLSARAWRRETLIRYANANQSEPLRILLSFLLAVSLLAARPLADAVGAPRPAGAAAVGYPAAGLASGALFARERGRRTKKLLRIEREVAVSDLGVVRRDAPGREVALRDLRDDSRVVAALCPDSASAAAFARTARGLRRRLASARVLAVAVGDARDADPAASCRPANARAWRRTFGDLLRGDAAWGADVEFDRTDAAWFALSFAGRSVGSGVGAPDLVEILGSLFPPRDVLAPVPPLDDSTPLRAAQRAFYAALTAGDEAAMAALFAGAAPATSVDAALAAGARVDPWAAQLRDGARPADLLVGDADEAAFGDAAITTAIEETGPGATLLAVKRWTRDAAGGAPWRLASHETIPFAPATSAGAVLKCDKRGCVCLQRSQQGRT